MSTSRTAPGSAVAVLVAGAALLSVVVLVVAWAGHGRSEHPGAGSAPRSVADAEAALRAGGLVVCSSRPVQDPPGTNAPGATALEVGSTDTGEASAQGLDGDGGRTCAAPAVARVTLVRFADAASRDAAARSVEGLVRPRGSAVVGTAGDLLVLVDGGSEDAPRQRVTDVLLAGEVR